MGATNSTVVAVSVVGLCIAALGVLAAWIQRQDHRRDRRDDHQRADNRRRSDRVRLARAGLYGPDYAAARSYLNDLQRMAAEVIDHGPVDAAELAGPEVTRAVRELKLIGARVAELRLELADVTGGAEDLIAKPAAAGAVAGREVGRRAIAQYRAAEQLLATLDKARTVLRAHWGA